MFILGIDIGTQSLKAVVLGEDLRPRGAGSAAYDPRFPQPLWAEQDPRLWLEGLRPAIGRALAEAGVAASDVGALGIAGQLDGCLPVDRQSEALGPCLIWMDRRASAETQGLPAETVLAKGGVVLDASHMAAKIRWLKRHHAEARAIARFHQPTSYVVARLTGRAVLDHAVASTSMLYDLWERRLDPELCGLFGIAPEELPEIDASEALAGSLSAAGAELTGLPAGIPVAVGTGDDFSNTLGAGVVRPGRVIVSLGTAEVVGAVHDSAVIDKGALVETHGYAGHRFFIENPGWLSGGALAWLIRVLRLAGVEELNALAAQAPPGADGVAFLPALSGAMAPEWVAEARGSFYGLTAAHGPEHLARALLEGCAFAMRDVVDRLAALGVDTARVRLLSGGAKSRVWAEIRAGLLRRPVEVAALSDSSPLGAALLAAVAAGAEPDLDSAADRLAPDTIEIEPVAAHLDVYEEAYRRYRRLFAALKPMFGEGA
ncbi:MAG TPA: FGGY family carbohydrate kinase [Dongiaceae bacterium]|nr:FGGY family carbohydrate kinase [Dongiaceae bacterium]